MPTLALKSLPQNESEVWQLVGRRLRVWNASSSSTSSSPEQVQGQEGEMEVPIQPHALLLCAIYPDGKLLSYTIGEVPELPPTPQECFTHLTSNMLKPPLGAQRRPGKVCACARVCVCARSDGLG